VTIAASDCTQPRYTVRAGDTLEGIAHTFTVQKDALMAANNLTSETLAAGATLVIPACQATPSHTPVFTLTYTLTPPILLTSHTP
jgi:LysM repeat protein